MMIEKIYATSYVKKNVQCFEKEHQHPKNNDFFIVYIRIAIIQFQKE